MIAVIILYMCPSNPSEVSKYLVHTVYGRLGVGQGVGTERMPA